MRKFISFSLLLSLLSSILIFDLKTVFANEDCFVVTAYYSPLPDQKYYFKWSYEADIILNGRWVRWASWKEVFPWMFAAPKKYDFWTKIYLDWVWVWEVSDRWWAIVQAWVRWYEYDRIDIWMWHWEEWLKRALTWWKKTVCNSKVLEDNETQVSINLSNFPAPDSALLALKKAETNIFAIDIWINSPIEDVKKLHEFLNKLGYYNWNINSKYNKDTVKAVVKFQLDNKIIVSTKNNWAWLWGNQTRAVAVEVENKIIEEEKKKLEEQNKNIQNNISDPILALLTKNEKKSIYEDSSTESIKEIQTALKEIWAYKWEISWKYSDVKDSLIEYQIKIWVIKNKNDSVAWYFWPKTNKQVQKDYLALVETKKAEEEKNKKIQAELALVSEKVNQRVTEHIWNIWTPKEWDVWANVRVLQQTLSMLWYFKVKDTAIFWNSTKNALIEYQLAKWIIKDKNEEWAWVFWPKTKDTLKNELYTLIETKILKDKNLLVYKK